jgi:hypothetical protein
MNKIVKASFVIGGLVFAVAFGARAYAQAHTCRLLQENFPGNNTSKTAKILCQHQSAGRGQSDATFVAKTQNNVKTLSVTMGCCTGMGATIRGLNANLQPINGCVVTAVPNFPASVTCNSAVQWDGAMSFIE